MSSIQFFFEDVDPVELKRSQLKEYVNSLILGELKSLGDISVIFCSDSYLLEINKKYLNHDYYTDIVTFDYVEDSVISGDLFISLDRVKENAETFHNKFVVELYRVVFHGVLHLVGYNDKTKAEQFEMRQKENFYLSEVDFSGIEL
ncbi:rRNA maturation RNase YbeY [Maribellus maritimus]|uniref:rRNA maturation RNase YbeY n=1 Tax=Maribellus maritimus TaxID=2870838 RepID=UPI001EEA852B|nr:rRNA maturation RNase YbeY [Maribellus maritimus]MCG6190746.1 rRNA maturation RNase YbeY [Maribellus maritimus]